MGLRKRAIILIKALQPVKPPPNKAFLSENIGRGTIVVSSRSKFSWVAIAMLGNIFDLQHRSSQTHGVRSRRCGTFMQPSRLYALSWSLASMFVLVGPREASV
jgi:hypothetical protein